MPEENQPFSAKEAEALDYFMSLKSNYAMQRQPWEDKWKQALAAFHLTDELARSYEGRAKASIPIMKWKANGIASRINHILFNVQPFGRLENKRTDTDNEDFVGLMSDFIFTAQLHDIKFKPAFKMFVKNKTIEGSAVAKITQESEEKDFTFFDDEEPQTVTVKDNTYFRNMLLTEFYSDVNKECLQDSQANIHSTVIPMSFLLANKKKKETNVMELIDPNTGEVVGEETETKTVGTYINLDLLQLDGDNLTDEQERYIEFLGLNKGGAKALQSSLKESRKTGFIKIDECYGKFDLDGDGIEEEVVCTIANGRIVIQLEPTPFRHKKYIRPFILGKYEPIANCLYGGSNVISGLRLLMELNASRSQATDAKTRSVANMWYEDVSKSVKWDYKWRPNGIVKGQGQNGLTPLLNPNLSNVSINDATLIQRDLDQLWSLSPVQEGTTDSRLIPSTARGTMAVIQQNDMPLNDIIDSTIDNELKPFFEMLYERNLVFKNVVDLLEVRSPEDLKKAGIDETTDMRQFLFEPNIQILGNLELSNEIAHQNGWMSFLGYASSVPPLAKRLDWKVAGEKVLRSFGIKDDAQDIWIDEETLLQVDQETSQEQAQRAQAQQQQLEQDRARQKEDYLFKKETDTEADLVKMQAEASIEKVTGQKIQ